MPSPTQIRAARALLGWRQIDLAERSGLSQVTVKSIESGRATPRAATMNALQEVFAAAGIEFLENGVMLTDC